MSDLVDSARPRDLSDPRVIRALAHPLRMSLLELLTVEGPRTATEAARQLGDSPSNCSFHLRQLEKYGYVEDSGEGTGRRRMWRVRFIGTAFRDLGAEDTTATAAEELGELWLRRQLDRWREARRNLRRYPREWQEVTSTSETVWWVTIEEQQQLEREISSLVARYRSRLKNPASRPEGAKPMEFVALSFPYWPPNE